MFQMNSTKTAFSTGRQTRVTVCRPRRPGQLDISMSIPYSLVDFAEYQ